MKAPGYTSLRCKLMDINLKVIVHTHISVAMTTTTAAAAAAAILASK